MSSEPITTSGYNGPERRRFVTPRGEDRRVEYGEAIAGLQVSIGYIKEAVDELKEAVKDLRRQSCSDCETARALQSHIEVHAVKDNHVWDKWKWGITTLLAVGGLLYSIFIKK